MAYRETPKTRARKAAVRQSILAAAEDLVTRGGFRSAGIAQVAEHAEIATGTVYRHFDSKGELFSEVFRRASQREVDKVGEALAAGGSAVERLERALRVFSSRALRAPTLAWSLIAEPVDPQVDAERLVYRHAYAELFEQAIRRGIEAGELAEQNTVLASAAVVGAIAEALVGPLSPTAQEAVGTQDDGNGRELVEGIVRFCIRALTEGDARA